MALRGETPFWRYPHGVWFPRAAEKVHAALEWFRRNRPEIRVTDRMIGDHAGIKRRCVQKGLLQLQLLGVIQRLRDGAVRVIKFLLRFPTKPKPEAKGAKGASEPAKAPFPAPTESHKRSLPITPLSPEEEEKVREEWGRWKRGRGRPGLGTVVPPIDEKEKARKEEEKRQRNLDQLAAMRAACGEAAAPPRGDRTDGTAQDPHPRE